MWLTLIIVGAVLMLLGFFTEIGQFLIWLGLILLIVSAIASVVRKSAG